MNNKLRANKWEREACRLLSLLVSGGSRKDLFWRTNSSGAKYKQTGETRHAGDIVPVCREAEGFAESFLIEAKWKRDFCFCDTRTAVRWLDKYGAEASMLGRVPLILVKGHCGKVYLLTKLERRELLPCLSADQGAQLIIGGKYVVAEVNS